MPKRTHNTGEPEEQTPSRSATLRSRAEEERSALAKIERWKAIDAESNTPAITQTQEPPKSTGRPKKDPSSIKRRKSRKSTKRADTRDAQNSPRKPRNANSSPMRKSPELEEYEGTMNEGRSSNNRFRFTSFPVFPIVHTKNVAGAFRREDKSFLVTADARAAATPNPEKEGSDIIVIHPGSRYLRIGRASDTYPKTIPHVLARKILRHPESSTKSISPATTGPPALLSKNEMPPIVQDRSGSDNKSEASERDEDIIMEDAEESEDLLKNNMAKPPSDTAIGLIEQDLKRRLRTAKRRTVPNAHYQVVSYNASSRPETILDHNDPYKVEWTDATDGSDHFVGQKALRLSNAASSAYRIFWPLQAGKLFVQNNMSMEAASGDLESLWTTAIKEELGIEKKDLVNHKAILAIPDTFSKATVHEMIVTLHRMGMQGVIVQQESVCATIGAGISVACVVDIGAQKTSVASIEDGLICAESNVTLQYGGDDITRFFMELMTKAKFPYKEMDLSRSYDWVLAEEMKERFCTLNEAHMSVQLFEFSVRVPDRPTLKYALKVYDEAFIAPMCLFYPGAIPKNSKLLSEASTPIAGSSSGDGKMGNTGDETNGPEKTSTPQIDRTEDTVKNSEKPVIEPPIIDNTEPPRPVNSNSSIEGTESDLPIANHQEKKISGEPTDLLPLDRAVMLSISSAAAGSEDRARKLFTSIVLVGGGGMVNSFPKLLEDRLYQSLPYFFPNLDKVKVLPSPRDMDPRLLAWKGAAVFSRLDSAKDMWIGKPEFDVAGERALKERAVFVWG